METSIRYLALRVGDLQVAVEAARVERVLPAFALIPAPSGPDILLGIADIGGTLVPVADLRLRLGQGRTVLHPDRIFVAARTGRRALLLAADAALGLVESPPARVTPREYLAPVLRSVKGMVGGQGGALWIQDLEAFLSWEEEEAVQAAMERADAAPNGGRP